MPIWTLVFVFKGDRSGGCADSFGFGYLKGNPWAKALTSYSPGWIPAKSMRE